ncbi:MAG: restriction endonuclease subunit S [Ottowia sp.]|nr:restriction endonuclease subunit S [Ottowia sp.]
MAWERICKLEDCLDALIDYRGKTPRKTDFGIPLITAKVVKSGHIGKLDEFIPEEDYETWMKRGYPEIGDVVLTTEAPLGEVAQIKFLPVALAQRIVTLRGKQGVLDSGYLLYLMQSQEMQEKLLSRSSGTTVIGIKQRELRKIEVALPSVSEQRAIAHILGTLDDKIELNRRQSETLQEMARALFKAWFVDFEPVRAKMSGRWQRGQTLPGLPAHLWDLFPDRLVETEHGEVPQGWEVAMLKDEFDVTMGQSPPGSTYNEAGEGLPFYQGRADFSFRFPKKRVYCTAPTRLAKAGDTLVSVRAPVGDINMAAEDCAIGRGVAAVRHKTGNLSYTYHFMNAIADKLSQYNAEGTVFGSINKKDFGAITHVKPSPEAIAEYGKLAGVWDSQIEICQLESHTLTALRDTLLPQLLSGALRVPDVEHILEEVPL